MLGMGHATSVPLILFKAKPKIDLPYGFTSKILVDLVSSQILIYSPGVDCEKSTSP
jgi:hypothetical protein